ncbi:MAG: alpha-amylase family glycosyl hydrolase [Bacteroidales bacterium]
MKPINRASLLLLILFALTGCQRKPASDQGTEANQPTTAIDFTWNNALVYFLLTDRFENGDPSNDIQFERSGETGVLRGFEGGDLRGVIRKLDEGYFTDLGVTALWLSPWFEQVHGGTDEGTGFTHGYHGYWTRDWTALDPNFGTAADLAELVEKAHRRGIRIVMDVIANHTGPVTPLDPVWPEEWVRTEPRCTYRDYESTVTCTLVDNLPDVRTESLDNVDLPPALLAKWDAEGRLETELAELDAFFERTGYPRAPRYYIIKWLTDYVRTYGVDGYRIDTAKHTEESVWGDLWEEVRVAFAQWKSDHPGEVLDDAPFYMVGEVYGYGISGGRSYDFGDRQVDYFAQGLHCLINFEFKYNAREDYETLFSRYSRILNSELAGKGVLNYLSSHDDGDPFDKDRSRPMEAATKLLLCPGSAQLYYGDESLRPLQVEGAVGDANLRSVMNWTDLAETGRPGVPSPAEVLDHCQKLGIFRRNHPAVGAGVHLQLGADPYVFSRTYRMDGQTDAVVVALDLEEGDHTLPVSTVFTDGSRVRDAYSGWEGTVEKGEVSLRTRQPVVLLEQIRPLP